jgi:hypothetical protein
MTANTCGCCELPAATPIAAWNRPGLSAIAFRVGTYASFRQSMLQRISRTPALSALRTRRDDDDAITVLDMWATIADVLSFYQERIANEAYLRPARLRDSILRHARLLDYQLRPGLAATSLLAFTLDANASLRIPTGLRVQSVPVEDEQPQVYETLESILAAAALNQLPILPAPEGFNPLARGSTSGILDPGAAGLAGAAALAPGRRFVVFDQAGGKLEELTVRALQVAGDRITLSWSGPVQGANWQFDSPAYAIGRSFRIFGHNAPSPYMEAVEESPGVFKWQRGTIASYAYTPAGKVIELDAVHEGIAAGTRLLVSQAGGANDLVTVTAVSQGPAAFPASSTAAVQGTVTRVTLDRAPAPIGDRRSTVLLEITSPRIRFWGYRYPALLAGPTVHVPALRIDSGTVAIGRIIENHAFTPGLRLALAALGAGRQVILRDAAGVPQAAVVSRVAALGLDPGFATLPDDPATALELRLDADQAERRSALRSAVLPAAIALTSAAPELSVAIGEAPARTIRLGSAPTTLDAAAAALQAAIAASLPLTPEFAGCRVTPVEDTLVVLPGAPGLAVGFGSTAADPTTAAELGLAAPEALRIDVLLSGDLASFPALTNPRREMAVSLGPIGPRTARLGAPAPNLGAGASLLQAALRSADPAPAFIRAAVTTLDARLLVVPGSAGAAIRDHLAITLRRESSAPLDAGAALLLGNVARASHGETVSGEILGDGDASAAFQKFGLQKNPLTFLPGRGPGGAGSSLRVLVNDVLWTEVPTLFGKGPADEVYTTRLGDDASVTVGFGDGRAGARLPSGRGNVVGTYRQGTGLAGRVAPGALRTPLDLPIGLKAVVNPIGATGGADPESIAQARENAPNTVRTFGRAVSLTDFEDLVRSTGEVAKALATWVWNGEARAVHLTIGAQGGQLLAPSDLARIHASLDARRDPNHALFVDNYVPVPIVALATVRVKSAYVAGKVGAAARTALLAALAFDALRFGRPLALSDIYAVLQAVPGVGSVDIDLFHFKNQAAAFLAERGASADPVQRSLRIFPARPNTVPWPPALAGELAVVEAAQDLGIATAGGLPD